MKKLILALIITFNVTKVTFIGTNSLSVDLKSTAILYFILASSMKTNRMYCRRF